MNGSEAGTGGGGAPVLAAGGIVLDVRPDGARVLLVKRGRPPSRGRWSLPGGRVERGEPVVDAVAREVREETGIEVVVRELVEVVEIVDAAFHYVIHDHRCEPVGGELRPGDDVEDAAFVRVDELERYGVTEAVARVVGAALSRIAPTS